MLVASEIIMTISAMHGVVARAGVSGVVSATAGYEVAALVSEDLVIARQAKQIVTLDGAV